MFDLSNRGAYVRLSCNRHASNNSIRQPRKQAPRNIVLTQALLLVGTTRRSRRTIDTNASLAPSNYTLQKTYHTPTNLTVTPRVTQLWRKKMKKPDKTWFAARIVRATHQHVFQPSPVSSRKINGLRGRTTRNIMRIA